MVPHPQNVMTTSATPRETPILLTQGPDEVMKARLRADSGSKRVLEPKHNRHVAKRGRTTRSKIRSPPRNTTLFQSENSIPRRYASIP